MLKLKVGLLLGFVMLSVTPGRILKNFFGAIQPNILGVPNSTQTIDINDSTTGTNLVLSGAAGQNIYVTHYHIVAVGTVNFSWTYGTGANCGTGTTTLDGPMQLGLGTNGNPPGIAAGTGLGAVLVVPAGKDLCLTTDANIQVGGAVTVAGPF